VMVDPDVDAAAGASGAGTSEVICEIGATAPGGGTGAGVEATFAASTGSTAGKVFCGMRFDDGGVNPFVAVNCPFNGFEAGAPPATSVALWS